MTQVTLAKPATRAETKNVPSATEWLQIADALAEQLASTAVVRDQTGGHAHEQRELIRDSGLLSLSIPAEFGGAGQPWSLIYQVVRRLARADSALAHVFAFHHLQVSSVLLYGNDDQIRHYLTTTVKQRLFWGNTLNPLDKRTIATEHPDGGYIFEGDKSFCSGARGSDYITASAWHEASQSLVVAGLPTRREGISVHEDWDAIGQRQTDSGTVSFQKVRVQPNEVLLYPGKAWTPAAHFRANLAQLVLVNLYVGIAEGAFAEAQRYTLEDAQPWFTSDATSSAADPYIQHRYGELRVKLRAAQVLADRAGELAATYFAKGPEITADERGDTAIAIAEAKVASHHAALEISNQLFDITGARGVKREYGFDRFWRNARTHTLHDPLDYKLRDLGRFTLWGDYPTPTSYS